MVETFFDIATLVVIVVTAYIAVRHLREGTQSRRETHEWNRRIETQRALFAFQIEIKGAWKALDSKFDYHDDGNPVTANEVKAAFIEDGELKTHLFDMLNFYEAIARGIDFKIYDEEMVKAARKNAMIRVANYFRPYIRQYRREKNPHACIKFTSLIEGWKKADSVNVPSGRDRLG